jgi:DNA-binding MarR family transcriptional regulator
MQAVGSPTAFVLMVEPSLQTKLVNLLERLAQAQRVLLWEAVSKHGLSPIQAQTLLHLSRRPAQLRRVGALAQEFDLSPPTLSDAVSTLQSKGLLRRSQSDQDRRVQILDLSQAGLQMVESLKDFDRPIHTALDGLCELEQIQLLGLLMPIAQSLVDQGAITVARMCRGCQHFQADAHPDQAVRHHCALLDIPLSVQDLRVDCPDFVLG